MLYVFCNEEYFTFFICKLYAIIFYVSEIYDKLMFVIYFPGELNECC